MAPKGRLISLSTIDRGEDGAWATTACHNVRWVARELLRPISPLLMKRLDRPVVVTLALPQHLS